MIVIGVDAHKRTHTLVALDAGTGSGRGELMVQASDEGVLDALRFAVGHSDDRVWAVEDCRHVTSRLERALLGAGERVVRFPPALSGESRKVSRTAGKSDPIDARAIGLAAIREGIETLPVAFLDQQAHEIRVLCDYRDQLTHERVRLINRLRWHLVRIAPHLEAQLGPEALKGTADPATAGASAWAAASQSGAAGRQSATAADLRDHQRTKTAVRRAHRPDQGTRSTVA